LKILSGDAALRGHLWANLRRARAGLARMGFATNATESPIVTVEIGSAERTVAMWRALLDAGVYTNIVMPPACRPDECLLRTSYSAAHTPEEIDRALLAFEAAGRALSIIDGPRAVDHRNGGMKLLLINPRNRVSLYGDYLWQPLAFGYVAAATPPHWEVELVDEQCEGTLDYRDVQADLVGLTAFTTQAPGSAFSSVVLYTAPSL